MTVFSKHCNLVFGTFCTIHVGSLKVLGNVELNKYLVVFTLHLPSEFFYVRMTSFRFLQCYDKSNQTITFTFLMA